MLTFLTLHENIWIKIILKIYSCPSHLVKVSLVFSEEIRFLNYCDLFHSKPTEICLTGANWDISTPISQSLCCSVKVNNKELESCVHGGDLSSEESFTLMILRGWLLRRTGRRAGRTKDVDTHWPWRLRSPLKVPSHSDTQSSCRICCGSGGTLLSCAVYAASKRAKKRRGSKRVQEEEEWGRERERVQTMSFCSGGNAAVNFAAPWKHITTKRLRVSAEKFSSSPPCVWCCPRLLNRYISISSLFLFSLYVVTLYVHLFA